MSLSITVGTDLCLTGFIVNQHASELMGTQGELESIVSINNVRDGGICKLGRSHYARTQEIPLNMERNSEQEHRAS